MRPHAEPTTSGATVVDPVCGMRLAPADAAATVERDGLTYHFCSDACRDTFTADPASDAATTAGHDTTNPTTVESLRPHPEGFGSVGRRAASELAERGATIVAVADVSGGVHAAGGLDPPHRGWASTMRRWTTTTGP